MIVLAPLIEIMGHKTGEMVSTENSALMLLFLIMIFSMTFATQYPRVLESRYYRWRFHSRLACPDIGWGSYGGAGDIKLSCWSRVWHRDMHTVLICSVIIILLDLIDSLVLFTHIRRTSRYGISIREIRR